MTIKREIDRAVRRVAALNRNTMAKTLDEQEKIIIKVEELFDKSAFDFSKLDSIILCKNGKKRLVKRYEDLFSPENILCQSIKQILDRVFRVKYPNRNKISHNLFTTLSATVQMIDFTIVKFDFNNYFNSISSIYAFNKYMKDKLRNRREIDLIRKFVESTKWAYAGLCTSNAIAEIISNYFDEAIRKKFASYGLIYYERYVDDCVLILNEHMDEEEVMSMLNSTLLEIFYDNNQGNVRCKTKFNNRKFQYISRKKILSQRCSIDFLGYQFFLDKIDTNRGEKITIQYGITQEKQDKYNERLDRLILLYKDKSSPDYNNIELLRHRIAAFSTRTVYLTKCFHKNVWKVKGFISNYGELRYLLKDGLIDEKTDIFLKNAINDAFARAGMKKPYFLMGGNCLECGYNLYGNMKSNKTLLLVDHIGYDYKSLVSLCKKVGISNIDTHGKRRGYGTLVRDYLIKVRVGY